MKKPEFVGLTALAFVLALFAGLVCSKAVAAPAGVEQIQREMLAPMVQLDRDCSASIVSSARDAASGEVTTRILTAKHCVADEVGRIHTIYAPIYQGNRLVSEGAYKADVEAQDYASDLAILKLRDKQTLFTNVVRIASEKVDLYEGEPVWAVGWSRAEVRTMTAGVFGNRESIAFPEPSKDTEYFRSTAQIAPGNSGGALFHLSANGYEQIGIAAAAIPSSDFMTFYTPIDAIQVFLKRVIGVSKLGSGLGPK